MADSTKLTFFWTPVPDQLAWAQLMPIDLQLSKATLVNVQFATCTKLRSQPQKQQSIKRQLWKLVPLKLQSANEQLSNLEESIVEPSWLSR